MDLRTEQAFAIAADGNDPLLDDGQLRGFGQRALRGRPEGELQRLGHDLAERTHLQLDLADPGGGVVAGHLLGLPDDFHRN